MFIKYFNDTQQQYNNNTTTTPEEKLGQNVQGILELGVFVIFGSILTSALLGIVFLIINRR